VTGELRNLTNSPAVWDEHGVYSSNGKKISFMSSYPYQGEPKAFQVLALKTEFMLMDADGAHLQQLTHFNLPGYPESQSSKTIAAVAGFFGDGSQMLGTVMSAKFGKSNWILTFRGRCGA
jgi:Tol biopolymer transport system component